MKIRFEVSRRNRCKTDCPYGYIDGYEGTTKKVGTYPCRYCMNFVGIDTKNKEVEFKADLICRNPK